MLRMRDASEGANQQGQSPPALPILLAVLGHFPVISGMNVGMGVHTQPNPLLGAVLVFIGWCIWLYAFHLCVRRNWKKPRLIVLVILAVPIVLATFGGILDSIYDQFNPFYLYLLLELLFLVGATRIVSRRSRTPRRGEESVS